MGVTFPAYDRKAVQLEVPKSIPIDATAKPFTGSMNKNGAALERSGRRTGHAYVAGWSQYNQSKAAANGKT
jgi:hypothetical protein